MDKLVSVVLWPSRARVVPMADDETTGEFLWYSQVTGRHSIKMYELEDMGCDILEE